jgi:polyribonucleotide 5'-hydroxyl-kinase
VSNVGAELLPAGEEHGQPLYSKTEPSAQLQHSLLAVLHAEWGDSEQVLAESTVMGFVYVYVHLRPYPYASRFLTTLQGVRR